MQGMKVLITIFSKSSDKECIIKLLDGERSVELKKDDASNNKINEIITENLKRLGEKKKYSYCRAWRNNTK